jgi:hypothetical protein
MRQRVNLKSLSRYGDTQERSGQPTTETPGEGKRAARLLLPVRTEPPLAFRECINSPVESLQGELLRSGVIFSTDADTA